MQQLQSARNIFLVNRHNINSLLQNWQEIRTLSLGTTLLLSRMHEGPGSLSFVCAGITKTPTAMPLCPHSRSGQKNVPLYALYRIWIFISAGSSVPGVLMGCRAWVPCDRGRHSPHFLPAEGRLAPITGSCLSPIHSGAPNMDSSLSRGLGQRHPRRQWAESGQATSGRPTY